MNLLKSLLDNRNIEENSSELKYISKNTKQGFDDSDNGLLQSLSFQDSADEISREQRYVDNPNYFIHATSIQDLCIRKILLSRKYNIQIVSKRNITANDRLVWAIGRAVEEHIRLQLLKDITPVHFFGDRLSCKCGKETHDLNFPNSFELKKCGVCKTYNNSKYFEKTFLSKDFHCSGNPDVGYWNIRKDLVINEIKSIKKEGRNGFEGLESPIVAHKIQAAFYNKLAKLEGKRVSDYVNIIYGCKSYLGKNTNNAIPYKIFKVEVDNELENVTERMIAKTKLYKETQEAGEIGERICNSPNCQMAKSCSISSICFTL